MEVEALHTTQETKEQRRTQILHAVCQCLKHKTSSELTIKDVAQKAGVGYGLVHFYFGSKENLLIETTRYIMDYACRMVTEEMAPYMGRPLTDEDVIAFYRAYHRRAVYGDFALYQEIWYDLSTQSRFSEAAKKSAFTSFDAYRALVSEPLGNLLSRGAANYQQFYELMMTVMEGMYLRIHIYGYDPEKEIQHGEALLRLLLKAGRSDS